MNSLSSLLLTLLTFLPALGAVVILAMPRDNKRLHRLLALAFSFVPVLLSGWLFINFDRSLDGIQFALKLDWIPMFDIHYSLGVDGLSAPLVMLTALLSFLAIVGSLGIEDRTKEYFFWFLLLETGMMGVFVAMDLFLFYVFWEITLVPMYFLIGIWGGPQKEYAAIKFFLFTLFGSVFMLVAIIALYFNSSPHTYDIIALAEQNGNFSRYFQILAFLGLFLGFAIKIPIFPFHTWLPLAHVEAPTAVSVILAGVLLKMGTYGILRVSYPILPLATKWFMFPLLVIAFINIIYGAFCALAQKDIKRMVAYSSINHMGYCLLGMVGVIGGTAAAGISGAGLQMVNHGIITGSLFLLVGVLYDRTHTRDIDAFGGLAVRVPVLFGLMTVQVMASLGLPGLAGFVSEFLCYLGAFGVDSVTWRLIVIVSALGIVITAAFFLKMLKQVFLGPLNTKWKDLKDINARELIAIGPLVALTVILGVQPHFLLDMMERSTQWIINAVK